MTVTSAAPAEPTPTPEAVPDGQWASRHAQKDNRFAIAIGVALLLHITPVAIAIGPRLVGISPAPAAQLQPFGDEAGQPDGVNVEMIDDAELKQRYIAFEKGRDQSDLEAPPTPPPPQRAVRQPSPPPQDETPEPTPELPAQISKAELEKIIQEAKLDIQEMVERTSQASVAMRGHSSDFVRNVLRRLKQTMPKTRGLTGVVVVRIVLTPAGGVEWVGVSHSSGKPELDRLVLEGIRTTQFAAATTTVPADELRFEITYDYF